MRITKDIRIGNNQWIRWVDNPTGNLLDIDEWLKPTIEFWDRLETQCLADCCGMAAFSFWPADIKLASESLDRTELINQITHLKSLIIQQPENVLVSEKLNNYLDRFVFIELLDHINTCLNSLE